MGLLEGKKVLITGGSRGIGAGLVRSAMQQGAEVAFTFHQSSEAAHALSLEMESLYAFQRCVARQCDVTDTKGMRDVVQSLITEFGNIDALVNNAGLTRDEVFARMSREHWDEVIATNLGSVFNATQPLVLHLVKQRRGSIINIASTAGIFGSAAQTNYSASKAGVIGFTKALSKEIAPFGVRVNAVAPGFIDAGMVHEMDAQRLLELKSRIPAGRLGTLEDVAQLVCFLASDHSSYITGQVIQVDGGLTL